MTVSLHHGDCLDVLSRVEAGESGVNKPLALDLFCCGGGATKGLQRAGFEVVGVDIRPQPRYCGDHFVQADALRPPVDLGRVDFIWASPPCQRHSLGAKWRGTAHLHPDLIEPTRALLERSGAPYVIENVPQAPIRRDLMLRGEMFDLKVCRQRHFELGGWWCMQPALPFRGSVKRGDFVTCAGHGGDGSNSLKVWRKAIGIDWLTKQETAEAIPPAYAEYIGRAALAWLQQREAA